MPETISFVAEGVFAFTMMFIAVWCAVKSWAERHGGLSFALTAWPVAAVMRLVSDCSAPIGLRIVVGLSAIVSAMTAGWYVKPKLDQWKARRNGI